MTVQSRVMGSIVKEASAMGAVVPMVLRAFSVVGALGVSLLVIGAAVAGTNEWTSSHVPNSSCDEGGLPSLGEALACHASWDAHDLNLDVLSRSRDVTELSGVDRRVSGDVR